jgi:hypothetical protein
MKFVMTKWHEENPNDWLALKRGALVNSVLLDRDASLAKLHKRMQGENVIYANAWSLRIGKDYPLSARRNLKKVIAVKKPKPQEVWTEIKCPACDGNGFPTVMRPMQPGRKIYPALCKQCLGKGRLKKVVRNGRRLAVRK